MYPLASFLHNYQLEKLDIANPGYANAAILALFLALALITAQRVPASDDVMDFAQTDQLRGASIFFIVLGHMWVHTAKTLPDFVFSGDGLSLFLILSGYGITRTYSKSEIKLEAFASRRIKRVMVPYWTATVAILALDYLLLGKWLTPLNLVSTFCGINLNSTLSHLDYIRWFITFILMWYVLFFCGRKFLRNKAFIISLAVAAGILHFLNYYVFHLSWYQFLSFPLGCAIGVYHEQIRSAFRKYSLPLLATGLLMLSVVLCFKHALPIWKESGALYLVPSIMLDWVFEVSSCLFALSFIVLIGFAGSKGYRSRLLMFLGRYSYEIILIHGAFLIKYNPIIAGMDWVNVTGEFFTFTVFICILSVLLAKADNALLGLYVKTARPAAAGS